MIDARNRLFFCVCVCFGQNERENLFLVRNMILSSIPICAQLDSFLAIPEMFLKLSNPPACTCTVMVYLFAGAQAAGRRTPAYTCTSQS